MSLAGNWHSYISNSVRASASFTWSDVRPHITQNHSWICGFHLLSLCFMEVHLTLLKTQERNKPTKVYGGYLVVLKTRLYSPQCDCLRIQIRSASRLIACSLNTCSRPLASRDCNCGRS